MKAQGETIVAAARTSSKSGSAGSWRSTSTSIDWFLLSIAATLVFLGLIMVASSSMSIAERNHGDAFFYFRRQLLFVGMAIVLGWVLLQIRISYWERFSSVLLVVAIILAILVVIPGVGKTVNASSRWLKFIWFDLQVSEVVKFLTFIYIGGYLVRRGEEVRSTRFGFFKPIAVLCFVALLLLLEPDFGATIVIMVTSMGVMFLGGVRFGQFLLLIVVFMISVGVLAISSPERMERITSFTNPWSDPFDSGFQLTQSLIAIGSGAWTGLGLGGSVQKLFYLPEAHTDFLFAVMAEELGLIGSVSVISLYSLLVWRVFIIAEQARRLGKPFATYIAFGFGLWLALQSFINIGVNMGVLPTKGLTLPLMSYGGSSLLMTAAVIAVLLRIAHESSLAERQATPRAVPAGKSKKTGGNR